MSTLALLSGLCARIDELRPGSRQAAEEACSFLLHFLEPKKRRKDLLGQASAVHIAPFLSLLPSFLPGATALSVLSYSKIHERRQVRETEEEYVGYVLGQGRPQRALGSMLEQESDGQSLVEDEKFCSFTTALIEPLALIAKNLDGHFPRYTELYEGLNLLHEGDSEDFDPSLVVEMAWETCMQSLVLGDSRAKLCGQLLALCHQAIPIGTYGDNYILLAS